METLRTVMLNIILIVFLTTLLDLLLPEGSMRSYIKMTMGFFVVLTLLQPVMKLADPEGMLQQWQLEMPAIAASDDSIQVQGAVYEQQQQMIEELYQEKMNQQVASLLLLTTELEDFRVDCEVKQQCLQQITVWVPNKATVNEQRVRQALSGYYGLAAEHVLIQKEEETVDGLERHE